ncbi:hypothetical protein WJX72_004764 [[Myrmecia] bisecta]|uniref:DUF7605 domain-containing protein n=1 Tax=[Myrmecia] bisecta TaxID=41462 RepID=A0AAW1PSY1_9CHLO
MELCYNLDNVKYEGKVTMVTKAEWTEVVNGLWQDLVDEHGRLAIIRDDRRPNTSTPSGAAQAALEAVYGKRLVRRRDLTLKMLLASQNKVTKLENKVTKLLGRVVAISERDHATFRKTIGEYVDSNKKRADIAVWPLVKLCQIRHNWQVLASGAVIVDLPGVRDANAARGAVAEGYLKKCNAIWIVADITRPVDNRTAKDLLGEQFRRQMLMDGQYGSITFVCTKTDVIQVSETVRSLGQDCDTDEQAIASVCALANEDVAKYMKHHAKVDQWQPVFTRLDELVRSLTAKIKYRKNKIDKAEEKADQVKAAIAIKSGGSGRIVAGNMDLDGDKENRAGGSKRARESDSDSDAPSPQRRRRGATNYAESDSDADSGMVSGSSEDSDSEEDDSEEEGSGLEDGEGGSDANLGSDSEGEGAAAGPSSAGKKAKRPRGSVKLSKKKMAKLIEMRLSVVTPAVQQVMTPAYTTCSEESGPGQFARMKDHMRQHVDRKAPSMFKDAAAKLLRSVEDLAHAVYDQMLDANDALFERLTQTFSTLWERPSCGRIERLQAVLALQGLAEGIARVCAAAKAEAAELPASFLEGVRAELAAEEERASAMLEDIKPNVSPDGADQDNQDENQDQDHANDGQDADMADAAEADPNSSALALEQQQQLEAEIMAVIKAIASGADTGGSSADWKTRVAAQYSAARAAGMDPENTFTALGKAAECAAVTEASKSEQQPLDARAAAQYSAARAAGMDPEYACTALGKIVKTAVGEVMEQQRLDVRAAKRKAGALHDAYQAVMIELVRLRRADKPPPEMPAGGTAAGPASAAAAAQTGSGVPQGWLAQALERQQQLEAEIKAIAGGEDAGGSSTDWKTPVAAQYSAARAAGMDPETAAAALGKAVKAAERAVVDEVASLLKSQQQPLDVFSAKRKLGELHDAAAAIKNELVRLRYADEPLEFDSDVEILDSRSPKPHIPFTLVQRPASPGHSPTPARPADPKGKSTTNTAPNASPTAFTCNGAAAPAEEAAGSEAAKTAAAAAKKAMGNGAAKTAAAPAKEATGSEAAKADAAPAPGDIAVPKGKAAAAVPGGSTANPKKPLGGWAVPLAGASMKGKPSAPPTKAPAAAALEGRIAAAAAAQEAELQPGSAPPMQPPQLQRRPPRRLRPLQKAALVPHARLFCKSSEKST